VNRRQVPPSGARHQHNGDMVGDETTTAEILQGRDLLVIAHQYDVFTKAQVDELAALANQVHVYVRYNRIGDLGEVLDLDALEGYGKGDKIAADRPPNVYVHPTPVTYLPVDPWYRRLGPHHYWSVSRQLAENPVSFDLVHAHFTWSSGYVGARIGEQYDIPSVLTIHENQNWLDTELSWNNERLEWALGSQDAIIRVNEQDCERLRSYNDTVVPIPNGFDPDRFPYMSTAAARDRLGLPQDREIVFSVGDLGERKRFDRLVEAAAALDRDVILGIGGRGEQREYLESVATEHADDVDARILGYLSNEQLAQWMNACDVFALASKAEGNPTVMFEALGCGKPYVGTNVGGVDEIITDDTYGLHCRPDDMAEFVSILESGLDREWDRETIRSYASQFTWERIVRDVARVYQAVWTDQRPTHPSSINSI